MTRPSLFGFLESIGAEPGDTVELRTQKRVLVMVSSMIAFLAIWWTALYLTFDEVIAASIPLAYVASVVISLAIFARRRRYRVFRFVQLSLILVLPFLLQSALGGFVNGSVVILWSLLAPIGALAISGRARALRWMIAYTGLVVLAQLIQPLLDTDNNLPDGVVNGFFVMNLVGPAGVAFFAMHYFVGQKDDIARQLEVESEKSENLLLNVLPRGIATELKETGKTEAHYFPTISVLFADIVGFTVMSQQLEPVEIVSILNEAFTHFDTLTAKYGLEKIRTIGDSYMVAAGVPVIRRDHAAAVAGMALEMMEYRSGSMNPLRFRIGISSGPAVAGVVGTSKFQYDVWGDTVNTASRMESHGAEGKIQISSATYELLRNDFVCEPRGAIEVKGKGEMQTWFLVGPRSAEATPASDDGGRQPGP